MLFNVNNVVRVKLNAFGRRILEVKYEELYKRLGKIYTLSKEDENGYTKFQMWDFMNTFGEYCQLGRELPFDPEIEI